MKIFFFGGTFDPPHLGHLEIAKHCTNLADKFIFIPAKQSPHKNKFPIASDKHRVEMLTRMIDSPKMIIEDFELTSSLPNYTIYTIHYLKNKWKGADLTMVVGEDQYNSLSKWYQIDEIRKNVCIMCFHRVGFKPLQVNDKKDEFISDFNLNISSTELRKSFKNNQSDNAMINQDVLSYIKENNLYL